MKTIGVILLPVIVLFTYSNPEDVLSILINPNNVSVNGRILNSDSSYANAIIRLARNRVIDKIVLDVDTNTDYRVFYNLIWYLDENKVNRYSVNSARYQDLYSYQPNRVIKRKGADRDSLCLCVAVHRDYALVGSMRKIVDSIPDANCALDLEELDRRLGIIKNKYRECIDIDKFTMAASYSIRFGRVIDVIYICHKNGFYEAGFARAWDE